MYERFSECARKILQLANQSAQRVNHEYIGTEDLLIGVCRSVDCVAARILTRLDVDLGKLRETTQLLLTPGDRMVPMGKLPFTPNVKYVIEAAISEARMMEAVWVTSGHLLMGLIMVEHGVASHVLRGAGVSVGPIREEMKAILREAPGTERAKAESGEEKGLKETSVLLSSDQFVAKMVKINSETIFGNWSCAVTMPEQALSLEDRVAALETKIGLPAVPVEFSNQDRQTELIKRLNQVDEKVACIIEMLKWQDLDKYGVVDRTGVPASSEADDPDSKSEYEKGFRSAQDRCLGILIEELERCKAAGRMDAGVALLAVRKRITEGEGADVSK